MCLCGGLEVAAAAAIGVAIVAKRKKHKLVMPTLAEMVGKVRAGIRPGQVFKDKRRKARVNEKAETRREIQEERD